MPLPLSVASADIAPLELPLPSANVTNKPPLVNAMPLAFLTVSVTVTEPVVAAIEAVLTETIDRERLTVPGVTVMVGSVVVTGTPSMMAVIVVAEPGATPTIPASYWPLPWSNVWLMTAAEVPVPSAKADRQAASVNVIAAGVFDGRSMLLPPATPDDEEPSVTIACAGPAAPGVTTIVVGVDVTGWPSIVAVMVAWPGRAPVKEAV